MTYQKILVFFIGCFLCIGSLFGAINPSLPSVVFVHLGEKLPSYLETAIKQARLFNSCNIILVANESALASSKQTLEAYKTECISCESLKKSPDHLSFLRSSKLDKTFRGGFWSFAVERFFYLQDLMQKFHLKDVVHLETDNMLYADITTLIPIFHKHYPQLALTLDNDGRCIPGFVYIASEKCISHLARYVAREASLGKNDMEALGSYYQNYGRSYADQLPIIMKSYVMKNDLISPFHHVAKNKFNYCQYEDEFVSIFDAAALGQYLGGVDPRNDPNSKPGFINESCVFNPSLLTYTWKTDAKGRRVPFAKYEGSECRINNLHIHCKKLYLFLSV